MPLSSASSTWSWSGRPSLFRRNLDFESPYAGCPCAQSKLAEYDLGQSEHS
jgi:hypothetical protein